MSERTQSKPSRMAVALWFAATIGCAVEVLWICFTGHALGHPTQASQAIVIWLIGSWTAGHRLWHAKRGEDT